MHIRTFSVGSVLTLLLVSAGTLSAQSPLPTNVDIARFQMSDDLYTAGGRLVVSEQIAGDLVAAGGEVHITGNVRRDVIAAGGQVELTGLVGDDVRVAGGTVVISSKVTGDMVVTGGDVTIAQGAAVGGDLAIFGGTVNILGSVNGKLTAKGGEITVNGTIGGDADIMAETFVLNGVINGKSKLVAQNMRFGPNSKLTQDVTYWTKSGAMSLAPARSGTAGTVFDPSLAPKRMDGQNAAKWVAGIAGIWAFFSIIASAVVALFFLLLFPGTFKDAGTILQKKPWQSLLVGFLYYVVMPIAIALLFFTLIGIPMALLLGAFYFFTALSASILSALVLARWMEHRMKAKWHIIVVLGVSIGILILLKFLWLIPILGWLLKMLLTFCTVGALATSLWMRKKHA